MAKWIAFKICRGEVREGTNLDINSTEAELGMTGWPKTLVWD